MRQKLHYFFVTKYTKAPKRSDVKFHLIIYCLFYKKSLHLLNEFNVLDHHNVNTRTCEINAWIKIEKLHRRIQTHTHTLP